eukprot:gnl/MRDRNA2_/MRDRNA2_71581_c0_seq1.p1 gnl/MRDRNA2_/MRDRNA2_71581_c0~~gnl/MRDRNA2_/MRDRNA2_71581_c0_seq1.p1  ORF type:complete len:283 (+),score=58.01 gnl/MRDRNA2_/MRDRNA2_71581_c0_seq1:27-851(+)
MARTGYTNLGPLNSKIVTLMSAFSSKDLASVASSCAQLSLNDRAVLESMARQGQARGKRLRSFQLEILLKAFDAAGFSHAVVEQLRGEHAERKANPRGTIAPSESSHMFHELDMEGAPGPGDECSKPVPLEEDEFFMEPWDRDDEEISTQINKSQKRGRRSSGRILNGAGDEDEIEEEDRRWPRRSDTLRTSFSAKEQQHPMENLFQDGEFDPVARATHARKLATSEKDDRDITRALSSVLKKEGLIFKPPSPAGAGRGRFKRRSLQDESTQRR